MKKVLANRKYVLEDEKENWGGKGGKILGEGKSLFWTRNKSKRNIWPGKIFFGGEKIKKKEGKNLEKKNIV